MRIAIVHSFYSSSQPSGENSAVADQVAALESAGHTVELVARYTDHLAGPAHVARSAFTASGFGGSDPDAILRQFCPDVIHVHNLFPNWGSSWIKTWGNITVNTLHNFRPVCAKSTLWRDGARCTLCPSHSSINAVRHACYRDSKLASLPLAIATRDSGNHSPLTTQTAASIVLNPDANRFYSSTFPNHPFHTIPNFAPAPPDDKGPQAIVDDFIYAGRLVEEKGILDLLSNWPLHVGLHIYGSGDLENQVRQHAASCEHIKFHGPQPRAAILEALQRSRGLVLPSQWPEGIPTIALEALACGTPLLVSKTISSADTLTEGGAGIVTDFRDKHSLDCAVAQVLEHSKTMRKAAHGRYKEDFSPAAWVERVERLYLGVIQLKAKER